MRMLAENPLFKQNPECFGQLIEKLAGAGANEILNEALVGQGVARQATPQRAADSKRPVVVEVAEPVVESRSSPTPAAQSSMPATDTQVESVLSSTLESTQVESTFPETLQAHSPEHVVGTSEDERLDQKVERVVRAQLLKHDAEQIRTKCMAAQHDPLLAEYLSDEHGLVDEEIAEFEFGITEEFEELVHFMCWKEIRAVRAGQMQVAPSQLSEAAGREILQSAEAPAPAEPTAEEMMMDLQQEMERLDLAESSMEKAEGALAAAESNLQKVEPAVEQAERMSVTPATSYSDNQLGDSQIYPSQQPPSVDASITNHTAHSKTDLRKWMVPGSVWNAGAVDELTQARQRIEAEVKSSQTPSSSSVPTASPDDVRAALTRATTLDLARAAEATSSENLSVTAGPRQDMPQPVPDTVPVTVPVQPAVPGDRPSHVVVTGPRQDTPQPVPDSVPPVPEDKPGHVSVVMTLAGIQQHVWVPMTAEAARAAGLVLSSEAVQPKPQLVGENSGVEGVSSGPGAAIDGEAMEVDEEAAAKALKSAYMRFYRSLQRNLAEVLCWVGRAQARAVHRRLSKSTRRSRQGAPWLKKRRELELTQARRPRTRTGGCSLRSSFRARRIGEVRACWHP